MACRIKKQVQNIAALLMKFAYEDLNSDQFEQLVVLICQKLLGISVQGFSKGPDGGRDAKFIGTAELHPSKAAPWSGTVIIQAKHTAGYNKTFSDSDFFSSGSGNTVLGKEIPKIKKLREGGNLDHYMLFSNRRLAGNAENDIRSHLSNECGIQNNSLYLCGVEQLELFFKNFPDLPAKAGVDPVDSPLIVSPDELADVVEALARQQDVVRSTFNDDAPTPRVKYETKNALNNMSNEYAGQLRKKFLKDTRQIHAFLAAPENMELLRKYEEAIDEFQLNIIAKRKNYQSFDEVMNYLFALLFDRDPILARNKRLTRSMLFYMYWNCDIGEAGDAPAN